VIARDRVGKKPLYHHVEDGVLYFASSLRALSETARAPLAVDPAAVDQYLALGYVPAPGRSTAASGSSRPERSRWWTARASCRRGASGTSPSRTRRFEGSFEDAVDELEGILAESVALRLRSDVPLGVFLSGGIDSSLVTALAVRASATPVSTFSIGFDDSEFDESAYAEQVARHLGTEHQTFRVHSELFDLLPKMAWHYGEPFRRLVGAAHVGALRAHPHPGHRGARGRRGHEGFGGYNWYGTAARLERLSPAASRPRAAAAGARGARRVRPSSAPGADPRRPPGARGFASMGPPTPGRAVRGAARLTSGPAQGGAALHRDLAAHAAPTATRRQAAVGRGLPRAPAARAPPGGACANADIETYLADDLLPKVDVASMAHGLEVRAPLLDQEVLRFALRLPTEYLVGPDGGKRPLRALLYRHVPRALFERPKQGFTAPVKRWFAGPLRPRVEALATSEPLLALGLRGDGVRRLVREHAAGARDHTQRLFALVLLDEWLRLA
jgi:asparagine synthase (glutamine-hydrolysing)